MANLESIIRLRRFQLDEKRQTLADLHRLSSELSSERMRLNETIELEQRAALAANDRNTAFAFGSFVQAAIERRKRIDGSLQKLALQIAAATDDVRAAFSDLKTFEQTEASREARKAKLAARAEAMRFDDMGVEGFRRRAAG